MDNRKISDGERVDIGDYVGQDITPETLETIAEKQVMVVMGGGKGDEGKGGDAYMLAKNIDYDLIVSAVGGPNAGHTVYDEDGREFVGHNLPGAAMTGKDVFLGQGKFINTGGLVKEIGDLDELGVNPNIKIAGGAHCLFGSLQGRLDGALEDYKSGKGNQIGTTKSGMGPGVALKALRTSLTISNLATLSENEINTKIDECLYLFSPRFISNKWVLKKLFKALFHIDIDEVRAEVLEHQRLLKGLMEDGKIEIVGNDYAKQYYKDGKKMLVEGSQSPPLGMYGGSYPYNTSTDTSFLGILSTLDIEPTLEKVGKYVVAKILPSAVGEHEFPEQVCKILGMEYLPQEKDFAVETGEKGSTTTRPRMVAFPSPRLLAEEADSPYTVAVSLRKLDVLEKFREIMGTDTISVVVDYEADGTPKTEEVNYNYAELIEKYREVFKKILGEEKGSTLPMILGYGPQPQDSRIDIPLAA